MGDGGLEAVTTILERLRVTTGVTRDLQALTAPAQM